MMTQEEAEKMHIKQALAILSVMRDAMLDQYGCPINEVYFALDKVIKYTERRGEWWDKGSLSCRCSECGCKSPKEYKFCPNCGARME